MDITFLNYVSPDIMAINLSAESGIAAQSGSTENIGSNNGVFDMMDDGLGSFNPVGF